MKKLIVTLACVVFAGCSDDKDTKTDTGTGTTNSACDSSLTFEKDIQSIVKSGGSANCAASGCHSNYGSLSGISSDKSSILTRVKSTSSSTVMPQSNLGFKLTADGEKLIAWLSCETLK